MVMLLCHWLWLRSWSVLFSQIAYDSELFLWLFRMIHGLFSSGISEMQYEKICRAGMIGTCSSRLITQGLKLFGQLIGISYVITVMWGLGYSKQSVWESPTFRSKFAFDTILKVIRHISKCSSNCFNCLWPQMLPRLTRHKGGGQW